MDCPKCRVPMVKRDGVYDDEDGRFERWVCMNNNTNECDVRAIKVYRIR